MKNRELGFGLIVVVLSSLLLLSGCASGTLVTEVPFGAEVEVGPLVVSSEKTGEGELLVTLASTAPEDLDVDVRIGRPEIGFDYSDNKTGDDSYLRAKFRVEGARIIIRSDTINVFPILLVNKHEVNRVFHTTVTVNIRAVMAKWKIIIHVDDDDLFTDAKYLRQLNVTDYWHPRLIEDNWERYLYHIGE